MLILLASIFPLFHSLHMPYGTNPWNKLYTELALVVRSTTKEYHQSEEVVTAHHAVSDQGQAPLSGFEPSLAYIPEKSPPAVPCIRWLALNTGGAFVRLCFCCSCNQQTQRERGWWRRWFGFELLTSFCCQGFDAMPTGTYDAIPFRQGDFNCFCSKDKQSESICIIFT